MDLKAAGVPQFGGSELRGVLVCTECRAEWLLVVAMVEAPRNAPAKRPTCGTYSGAITHFRRHEEMCEPCRAAKNVYVRGRRQANKGRVLAGVGG